MYNTGNIASILKNTLLILGCARSAGYRDQGLFSSYSAQSSHSGGFSSCGSRLLVTRASVVVVRELCSCGSRAPEQRLSRCGTQA